ncbi:MAG: hypothetical protein KDD70_04195 [Bdellovibrionales bacterium]|nr:hypothetical protein [Bdellovibrionales bacterium]
MNQPSPEKLREWRIRASRKNAIVPYYFEVFPKKVVILCGNCHHEFQRPLVPNLDEPTFVCPEPDCRARNWVPVKYDLRYLPR